MRRLLYGLLLLLSPLLLGQGYSTGIPAALSVTDVVGTTSVCSVGPLGTPSSVCLGSDMITAEGTNTVTITNGVNDKVDFVEDPDGTPVACAADIAAASYSASGLATATAAAMNTAGICAGATNPVETYSVSYSATTGKYTISATTVTYATFDMPWATGTNTATSAKTQLGFAADVANAATYTGAAVPVWSAETILAFGNPTSDNTLTILATSSGVELNPTTGALLTKAGTGTGRVSVGGVICKSATPAATSGTAEEILATCPLPAGTMTVAGGHVRFQIQAVTAANGNNKTLKVYLSASGGGLAGNVCFTTPAAASNNELWIPSAPGIMFPTTATTGRCSHNLWRGPKGGSAAITAMPYHTDQLAQTWANALELVISGTTPTAAGDLTLTGYTVEVVQ